MSKIFSVNASCLNSYVQIANYLEEELNPILKENRPIIFICIGSDRSTGDSLGPLIGYKLNNIVKNNFYIYGTLADPIHAKNIIEKVEEIKLNFYNPFIIAIDSCLGSLNNIEKIFIDKNPIYPGSALNKNLPAIGDMSIVGIVNISSGFEFLILQNTRLYTVINIANCIYKGIYYFILKNTYKSNNFNINKNVSRETF